MYYVYVLKSKSTGKIYVGHSLDIERRFLEHCANKTSSKHGITDWMLVRQERYPSRSLAVKREKFFKTGDGRRVLKLKTII